MHLKDFLRGLHKPQDRVRPENPDQHQAQCDHKRGQKHRLDRCFHFSIPFCPKILGDHDRRADAQSRGNRHKEKRNRSRCTDGCQCICSHIISHNDRINNIIKLLKKISEYHRHCKEKQCLPRISFCHILCHNSTLCFPV